MMSKILLIVVLSLSAIILFAANGSNVHNPHRPRPGSKGLKISTKRILQYSREKHNLILRFLKHYDTTEMGTGPHSNINETNVFDCTKASVPLYSEVENPNNSLVCSCKDVKRKVELQIDAIKFNDFISPDWAKIKASTLEFQSQNITKLFLIKCSFVIGNEALKVLNLPNLRELYIADSESLLLKPKSLVFSNRDVNVTIYKIGNLMYLPKLHPTVSTLMLDTVTLNDFCTNDFVADTEWLKMSGPGKNINVIIKNSIIEPAGAKFNLKILNDLKLKSIIFDSIKF